MKDKTLDPYTIAIGSVIIIIHLLLANYWMALVGVVLVTLYVVTAIKSNDNSLH